MEHIGQRIKSLRKKAGLTQDRLAEALGVSPQAISKWEVGQASPDLALIAPLTKAFGITADELLGIAEEREDGEKRLLDAHRHSMNNRAELGASERCGCFFCRRIFRPQRITRWVDQDGNTALCPFCGIDSVIGSAAGFPMQESFFAAMHKRWFGRSVTAEEREADLSSPEDRSSDEADGAAGKDCMQTVRMERIFFGGRSGKLAENIIRNWLIGLRESNPAILAVFAEREKKPARDLLPWSGEFAGKYITGAYYIYRMTLNAKLYEEIRAFIPELLAVQGENGYLGCWSREFELTGQPGGTWDAWGHYHILFGLLLWYRETRDPLILEAIEKAAGLFLRKFYNPATGNRRLIEMGSTEMNLAPIHVFALLYGETGRRDYLDFALRIAQDLTDESAGNYLNCALEGIEFYRCPKPRWESLHIILGLAELYRATGEERYLQAALRIYWSIRQTDVHNTGAFSTNEAAIGNPFTSGPIETCCVIAYNALAVELLKLTGEPAIADELEISHYNACMGLWSPSGRWSTYDTPMNGVRTANTASIVFQSRPGSPELNCCSVNAPRAVGMLSEWAFMKRDGTLVINFYERGDFVTETGVSIRVEGSYPADGKVSVHVEGYTGKLALRIPFWSVRTILTVGAESLVPEPGAYWIADCPGTMDLRLRFDMAGRRTEGKLEYEGKWSVYRGPVLFGTDARLCGPYDPDALPPLDLWQIVRTPNVSEGEEIRIPLENGVELCDFYHLGNTGARYVTWLPLQTEE